MGALYRVAVKGTMAGQIIVNTFGWMASTGVNAGTQAQAQTVADLFKTAWTQNITPKVCQDYVCTGVEVRSVTTPGILAVSSTNTAGLQNLPALPSWVALRVKLNTADTSRRGKGRTGIAGVLQSATALGSPNAVTSTALTSWQQALNTLLSATTTADGAMAVIGHVLNPDKTVAATQGTVVTSVTVQNALGSRLSRLR